MEQAYLHPAYVWDCDACGQENFVRAVRVEMTEEDEVAMKEEYGVEPFEEGCFLGTPDEVRCVGCGTEYECSDD